MIGKKLMSLAVLLAAIAVVVGGCAAEQPTATAPAGMLNAQQAFDVALTWLRAAYPDEAPAANITWSTEDMVPLGSDGQPLAGAARTRISSPDWVADVTWALLSREFILYDVTLRSSTLGWYWEGTVRAVGGQVSEEIGMQTMSVDLASELARQFVVSSVTYMAGGISGTVVMSDVGQADCPYCWTFEYAFTSKNSGYGNGAGQVVIEKETRHRAVIAVEAMEVTEALMDGRWDMMAQRFIQVDEEGARALALDFVRNSPTFVFDGIVATLEVAETIGVTGENAWTFSVSFQSAHAGYGDRTGQALAEVITPHVAQVTIANGDVVRAVLDDEWDMLRQEVVA